MKDNAFTGGKGVTVKYMNFTWPAHW